MRRNISRILHDHLNGDAAVQWGDYEFDFAGASLVDADFSGASLWEEPWASASFASATFYGVTSFVSTAFPNGASFSGAQFYGNTSFSGASFRLPEGCVGPCAADFSNAQFLAGVSFSSAVFDMRVSFAGTWFSHGSGVFESTVGDGPARFKEEGEFPDRWGPWVILADTVAVVNGQNCSMRVIDGRPQAECP